MSTKPPFLQPHEQAAYQLLLHVLEHQSVNPTHNNPVAAAKFCGEFIGLMAAEFAKLPQKPDDPAPRVPTD